MIPLVLVIAATLVLGMGVGWLLRAENGRGAPRPTTAQRGAPPYDWAQEPDL